MATNEKQAEFGITPCGKAFRTGSPPDSPSSHQLPTPDLRKRKPAVLIILSTVAFAWLLTAVFVLSDAGVGLAMLGLIGGGCLLGVFWLVAVFSYTIMLRPWTWQAISWAAVVPLTGMLGIVLAFTDADLTLRVWLCDAALRRYATTTSPHYSPPGEWVGLFFVDELDTSGDAFAIYTSANGLFDRAGIAYVPPGCQPPPGVRITKHLYGNWYRFWWKF